MEAAVVGHPVCKAKMDIWMRPKRAAGHRVRVPRTPEGLAAPAALMEGMVGRHQGVLLSPLRVMVAAVLDGFE